MNAFRKLLLASLAAALVLPASAVSTDTRNFVTNAMASYGASEHSDANGTWTVPASGEVTATPDSGTPAQIAFELDPGDALRYAPAAPSPENLPASVSVTGAVFQVGYVAPSPADVGERQAAIALLQLDGDSAPAFYGWAGGFTVDANDNTKTNLTWIKLSPSAAAATTNVVMDFVYGETKTVTFKINGVALYPVDGGSAANAAVTLVNNDKTRVFGVSFSGAGSFTGLGGTYDVQLYDVTFYDGATEYAEYAQQVEAGALASEPSPEPTKGGFSFEAWTNGLGAAWAFATDTVTADTRLGAQWTASAVTITWNVEGTETTSSVAIGDPPVYSGTPAKAQDDTYTYEFAGWAASSGGEVLDSLPVASAATTYYAVFTPVFRDYTITWNYKDATGADTSDTTTVHWGGTPSHAAPAGYVANGTIYAFDAWNTVPAAYDGTTTAYTATYTSTAAKATVFTVSEGGVTNPVGTYATLAEAVGAAVDGATVLLLGDVTLDTRLEPNVGENTAITIDLGGNTITRTGTSGNGSAFDVKSGDVTIRNGTIDCTQDDTAIAADGVYAITSRSGSNVTLADLAVTVDSECGACAYPFAGSTMTIESGTYANVTTTPYRYNTDITGMAVNQPNNATRNLVIKGGSFSQYDPQLGDDSGAMTDFTDDGFVAIDDGNGHWVVQAGYNVTFDANGGSPDPAAQRVAAGALVTAPATNPAKAGDDTVVYVFNAWQLNDADYDFAVAPTADITLVADYTATSLANAIWIGGASGDWNVPANWDIGYVPTKATVVTFTNDATVGIAPTVCKCKEIVLDNADVTIGRADPVTGADLNFYKTEGSAVSGTGTLALDTVGMFNQNNAGVITIGTALDIRGDVTFKGVKDGNQHAGSWTITGKTTIADGVTVKSIDDAITTFQGDIDIGAGSQVTFFAAYGANEQYHGGEIVASKVTLAHNEGSLATKLVLETRNKGKITISDSQVVTDDAAYEVKKSSADGKTTYEAVLKTFSVIWLAEDGATQLDATNGVPYGTSYASLAAPTPTKDGDANALYTFAAWTPAPDATVTSNATYTASFKTWIKVAVPTAETSLVYDGTEKTGVAAAANGEYTVSGNTATDAGSYTATATLADTANTVWADDTTAPTANAEKTIAWSIAKRAITVTAENASKIAGNPDPVFTASITSGDLAGGQEIAYTFSVTDGADAATKVVTPNATITASGVDVTANYTITAVPGTLTIGDAVATVFTVADNGATTNDVAYYATFAEAVSAAQAGQTVLLLADDAAERISFGKDLTLDLGGRTFTGRVTIDDGTATVQNGTIVGRLDAYDSSVVTLAADAAVNGQVVVWGDGTFGEEGCKTPVLNVYGTVTHTGDGAITCNGTDRSGAVINVYDGAVVTSTDEIGIYLPSGNLTVTGGTITGATAVYAKSGSVNISGGTLRGTGAKADYAFMGDGANATGDALVIDNCGYPNGVPAVSVTGGTFVSDNAQSVASYAKDDTFAAVDEFIPATVDGQPNPARFSDADADGVPAGYALVLVEGSDPEMYAVSALAPIQYYNTWSVANVFYFDDEDPIPSRTTQGTIPTIKRTGESSYHAVEDWVQISWTVTSSSAADASTPDDSIATVDDSGLVTFSQPGTVKVWLTMTDPSGATKSASKTVKYAPAPAYVISADGNTRTAYASLYSAFNAAQDGETVVLGADATVTNIGRMTLNADKAITLDLNGHTVSLSQNYREGAFGALFTVKKGSLAVVDTAETKGGIAVSGNYCRAFNMDGTANQSAADAVLTIGAGVNVSSAKDCCVTMFGPSTLNTAGNLSSPNDFAIAGNGSSGNGGTVLNVTGGSIESGSIAIYQPQDGELNISGGTIAGTTAVYVKSGEVTVTGGTLHGTGTAADYTFNGNGANSTGDALVVENCGYPGGAPTASITGGTFISDNAQSVASYAKDENYTAPDDFIPGTSAAKFSDADADGVAEGYTLTPVAGTSNPVLYEVVPAYTILWVAEGVTLQTDVVATNTTPVYTNAVPTKAGHEFLAWSPVPAPAVSNTTYTATWTVNQHDVIWVADGSQFESNRVDYGTAMPVPSQDPTKAGDDNALYTFVAWTPAPDATVTSNATYTADFKTWTKIAVPTAAEGLVYTGSAQTGVAAAANGEYAISGNTGTDAGSYTATATLADTANTVWADDTAAPTANAAKTVSWSIAKAPLADLAVSLAGWTEGDAANAPVVSGNAGGGAETVTYSADGTTWSGTQPTAYGTYTVKVSVPETANYLAGEATAIFTIDERGVWTIIWLADDGTEIDRTQVTDGDLPTHADATKSDDTGKYDYSFTGWDPEVVVATAATSYQATFSTSIAKPLAVPLADHAADAAVDGAAATVALAPAGTIDGVAYTAVPAASWSDATASFSFEGLAWNAGTTWTVDAAQGADPLDETAHNEGTFYAKASTGFFTADPSDFEEFDDMGVAGVGYANSVASAAGETVRVHTTIDVPEGGLSSEPAVGDSKAGFAVLQLAGDAKAAFYAYDGTSWTKLFGVEPKAGDADYLAVYDFAASPAVVRYYIDGVPLYAEGEGGAKVYAIPLDDMDSLSTVAFGSADLVKDDVVAVQDVSYVATVGETPYTNAAQVVTAVGTALSSADTATVTLLKDGVSGEIALAVGKSVTVVAGSCASGLTFTAPATYKVVETAGDPATTKTYTVELDLATVIWFAEGGETEVWRTNAVIGTVPVYEGPAQTKAATDAALYTFSGWTDAEGVLYADALPAVAAGGTNYVATFKTWTKVARPTVATGLEYDGTEQTGVTVATGSTATGTTAATDAGSYPVTVALDSADSVWADATDPADATARETVTADWSIARKAVTVTADDKSKIAGNADPELTATVVGTIGTDTVAYELSRAEGEAAGEYAITPSGTAEQGNYAVSFAPGTFTIAGAQAMVISIADAGTGATATNYVATLADAFLGGANGAKDGDTVELLGDVTLDARILVTNSVTIDLGGYTVARTAAPDRDNGSAFRVDGDCDVTIKNGAIDCSGVDDTSVIGDGVFAIDVKNGGDLVLADLDVTVDSRNGACVYPWAGSTVAIESGNYANLTGEPYDYHRNAANEKDWVGMAVNQANGQAGSLITITGGTFSKLNPMLGDDSAAEGTMSFVDPDYFAVADGGAFTVVPRIDIALATVTVADDLVYDGDGKAGVTSVDYGTTNLVLDTDYTVAYAANTNAGTASATLTGVGLWTGTVSTNFAIAQRSATFTAESASKVYDGQPLTTNDFTAANLVAGHTATATVVGSQTAVGVSSNVVSAAVVTADGVDVTANYVFTYVDGELEVTPAAMAITIAGVDSTSVYTGVEQTTNVAWTASSETVGFDATKVSYTGEVSVAGTDVADYAYNLDATKFVYADDNFTATFTVDPDGKFAITPAKIAVPTAVANLVYDGTEQTGVEEGTGYTLEGNTGTAAGDYTATATLAANYAWADETLSGPQTVAWSIGKATVAVTAENKTQVYGEAAEALTYTTDPATLIEGNSFSGALAREEGDDVGPYAITQGTLSAGDNYEIDFTGATYTITAAPMTITVAGYNGVYDGAAHQASATTVPDGATVTWSTDGGETWSDTVPSVTGVANVAIVAKATLANYAEATATTSLVVTAKAVTFTAAGDTKVYDGTALVKDAFTSDGLVEGHTATATVTGSQTIVGASSNVVTAAVIKDAGDNDVTANYDVTYKDGELKVTAATVDIPAAPGNKVYNGQNQTADVTAPETVTVTNDGGKNVGDYTVTFALNDPDNYTWSDGSTTNQVFGWKITQKALKLTADDQVVAHGEAAPNYTYTPDGLLDGDGLDTEPTLSCAYAAGVAVGTYTIEISGAVAPNYAITYANGTLTVTSNAFTVIWLADDGETEFGRTTVEWGEMPAFAGSTDKSDATGKYAYRFTGWSPALTNVTAAATYTATYATTVETPLALAVADPKLDSTAVTPLDKSAKVKAGLIGAVEGVQVSAEGATSVEVSGDNATATFSDSAWKWNQGVEWTITAQQTAADDAQTAEYASLPGKFYVKPETSWFTATTNELESVSDASDAAVAYTNAAPSNEGEMVRVHTKIAVPAGGLPAAPATGSAKVGFAVLQLENDTAPAYYAFGNGTWTKLDGAEPTEGDHDYLAVYDLAAETPTARYYIDGVALYSPVDGGDDVYALPLAADTTSLQSISFASKEIVKDDIVAEQDVSYVAAVGDTPFTDGDAAVAVQAKDPDKTMALLKQNVGITPVPLAATTEKFVVDYTLGSFTNDNPAVSVLPGYEVTNVVAGKVSTYELRTIDWPIEWVLNGGVNDADNPDTYTILDEFEFKAATRLGYDFKGWTNEVGTVVAGVTAGTTGAITNGAKWEVVEYAIAYTLADGVLPEGESNPATYTIESPAIALVNPTKTGYDFAGWTGTGLDAASTAVTIPTGSTGDRAYTATWTPALVDYVVKHLQQSVDGQTYVEVEADRETKQGYTGSQTEAVAKTYEGFQAGVFEQVEIKADGSTVVEIKYDRATFVLSIAYAYTNGTQAAPGYQGTLAYGATYSVDSPVVANYTAVPATVSGTMGAAAVATNVVYTATPFAIAYDLDGGATDPADANPTSYTVETETFTLANPTKDGFTFAGWTGTDLGDATNLVVTVEQGSSGERSYTAHWAENKVTVIHVVDNGDGTATTNATGYVTIADALAAAQDGDTVRLLDDSTDPAVALDKEIVLDLDGNTWAVSPAAGETDPATVFVSDAVAIVDSSENGGGKIVSGHEPVVTVADGGALTVGEGAAIGLAEDAGNSTAVAVAGGAALVVDGGTVGGDVDASGTVHVDGGTVAGDIDATGEDADVTVAGGTVDGDVTVSDGADVAVSGGEVTGGVTATGDASDVSVSGGTVGEGIDGDGEISVTAGTVDGGIVSDGTLTVSGGTVNAATGGEEPAISASGTADISGGTVSGSVVATQGGRVTISDDADVEGNVEADGATVEISGGTVNGTLSESNDGDLSVTGGHFTVDPSKPVDYVADGFVSVENEKDGGYDVIARLSIEGTVITVAGGPYTGAAYEVQSVDFGTTNLLVGTDCTVAYTNAVSGTPVADNVNAGTIEVTVTGIGKWIGTVTTNFVIAPATVTVTAKDATVKRGTATLPAFEVDYDGFVNNEDESVLATAATAAAAANGDNEEYSAASRTGATFPIVASGAVAANYVFEYVDGTLTVVAGAIASVDGTEYEAIADAVSAAGTTEDGKVVTMLDDADAAVALVPGDVLKIALEGFSVTVKADDRYAARWSLVSDTADGVTTYTLDEIKAKGLMITEFDYAGAYLVFDPGKAEDLAWASDEAYCTVVTATDLAAERWEAVSGTSKTHAAWAAEAEAKVTGLDTTGDVRFFRIAVTPYELTAGDTVPFAD